MDYFCLPGSLDFERLAESAWEPLDDFNERFLDHAAIQRDPRLYEAAKAAQKALLDFREALAAAHVGYVPLSERISDEVEN